MIACVLSFSMMRYNDSYLVEILILPAADFQKKKKTIDDFI